MKKPSPLVEITGTGRFLPDDVVTNDDLAERLDTSDEWIRNSYRYPGASHST
ncbi:MAG: hypothetical protein CM1200mP14_24440 [Gammaproteobacteria bacterium]|nr:MAG: hypothetical protein CM1200mP14_24440 [Gammaproteobacteria bacterium]